MPSHPKSNSVYGGFCEAVGNTPLLRLKSASRLSGCEIYGKAEFLNPGGSVKDRAAVGIIRNAEQSGLIKKGGLIVEGTAGNTGIGLALVGNECGYRTYIVMPKTQSLEKQEMLKLCGAELELTEAVPYKDPRNYIRLSQRRAEEFGACANGAGTNGANGATAQGEPHTEPQPNPATQTQSATKTAGVVWANQFDNLANSQIHQTTTAPEIWQQTAGKIAAFTCAVGTGGTISGVSRFLKQQNPQIRITVADPMGSGLYSYYQCGEAKPTGSSVTEGIGQSRITANLKAARIDNAIQISDTKCLHTLKMLVAEEGLFLGGSSGINVAAAIEIGKQLPKGSVVVTILCDGGERYRSKLYNRDFLKAKNLPYLY